MSGDRRQVSCTSAQESIEPYLDGELSVEETEILENHFEICTRCQHELSVGRGVLDGLHGLPPLECPDRVTDEVFERVHASVAGETPVRRETVTGFLRRILTVGRIPRPVFASALIVLIVFSALIVGRINRPTEQITADQIAEAEAAVKWTFAYVSDVGRRSGLAVRDEVFDAGVIQPMQRAVRSSMDGKARTTESENGGSI